MPAPTPRPGTADEPLRDPVACGALGRYDRRIVDEMTRRLEVPMWAAHDGADAVLMLDRAPIAWRRRGVRGYAWSEAATGARQRPRSWQEASTEANACGLVLAGKRRFVHSSVSGMAPVYHLTAGDATYFCSRLDALVWAAGERLTPDWDAWASIICLRSPVGTSTTFNEAKRLHPFTRLEHREGRARVRERPWPWAELHPTLSVEEGVEPLLEALGDEVAPLQRATSMLTAGLDSRILGGVMRARGVDLRAVTLIMDDGGKRNEHELVVPVAEALGAPHTLVEWDPEDYWNAWIHRTETVEYMQVGHPGLAPLAPVLAELGRPAIDGLALDTLTSRGGRFYTREMFDEQGSRSGALRMWRVFRRHVAAAVPAKGFQPNAARAIVRSSRRQFAREARRFRGHPNAPLLQLYVTRTMRAVGPLGHMLGRRTRVYAPAAAHRAAIANLAIRPLEKTGFVLYNRLLPLAAPTAAELPTSATGFPSRPATREQIRFRPDVVRHYEELIPRGPLAPHTNPEVLAAARNGEMGALIQNPGFHRATLALATFQLWYERYEPLLGEVDPAPLIGEAEPTRV